MMTGKKKINHILSGFPVLAKKEYSHNCDTVGTNIQWKLFQNYGMTTEKKVAFPRKKSHKMIKQPHSGRYQYAEITTSIKYQDIVIRVR